VRVDEGKDNNYFSLLIPYIVEEVQMKMKTFVILYSIFIKSLETTTFCILCFNACVHMRCVDFDAGIKWFGCRYR
jgi:hypothetical protein